MPLVPSRAVTIQIRRYLSARVEKAKRSGACVIVWTHTHGRRPSRLERLHIIVRLERRNQTARSVLQQFFAEQMRRGEPYTVTKAGRRPQVLKHKKLMYGTPDEDGLIPIYNSKPMPALPRRVAEEVQRQLGAFAQTVAW